MLQGCSNKGEFVAANFIVFLLHLSIVPTLLKQGLYHFISFAYHHFFFVSERDLMLNIINLSIQTLQQQTFFRCLFPVPFVGVETKVH